MATPLTARRSLWSRPGVPRRQLTNYQLFRPSSRQPPIPGGSPALQARLAARIAKNSGIATPDLDADFPRVVGGGAAHTNTGSELFDLKQLNAYSRAAGGGSTGGGIRESADAAFFRRRLTSLGFGFNSDLTLAGRQTAAGNVGDNPAAAAPAVTTSAAAAVFPPLSMPRPY